MVFRRMSKKHKVTIWLTEEQTDPLVEVVIRWIECVLDIFPRPIALKLLSLLYKLLSLICNKSIETRHKYIFQNTVYQCPFKTLVYGYFEQPFSRAIRVRFKKISNFPSRFTTPFNFIIFPCVGLEDVIDAIQNKITKDLLNFAQLNNMKILIAYTREYISEFEIKEVSKCLDLNKNIDSQTVDILVNGFSTPEIYSNKNLIKLVSTFDALTRVKLELTPKLLNRRYNTKVKKLYNFSAMVGTLANRKHRILFLQECDKKALINEQFFYSIINADPSYSAATAIKMAKRVEDPSLFLKTFAKYSKHKAYDMHGRVIAGGNYVYDSGYEDEIIKQVTESYINIVLESRPWSPSITEKIYKPIIAGIPFVWHGYQNILPYLESKGYRRYSFIDYKFDEIEEVDERLHCLVDEIQRLSTIDLEKAVQKDREISIHNQQTFLKTTEFPDQFLYTINERL